jgi:hypothetical protein
MRHLAVLSLWILAAASVIAFARVSPRAIEEQRLFAIAMEFKDRLGIAVAVPVAIIDKNERLASVRPVPGRNDAYLLEVDAPFLASLTDEEKRAIVAHELGHVWIFTHHPFLQSEPLANEEAERVVTQGSLEKVYRKVWALGGQDGTLTTFMTLKMGFPTASDAAAIPALQQRTADREESR